MASKYDAINQIKKNNPQLTWTQAAHKAGFEGEWTSHKGRAKPRTGDKAGQASKRRKFDTNSTDLAKELANQLNSTKKKINGEASLYEVEPTQMEHLADQDDAKAMTSGAPGDPDNKLIVKESDARFKDKVKQAVGNDYSVTNNPAEESVKVVENKFFDPIADPNTLPGKDIRNSSELDSFLEWMTNGNNRLKDILRGRSPKPRLPIKYGASMIAEYGDAALELADRFTDGKASKAVNGAINGVVQGAMNAYKDGSKKYKNSDYFDTM